MYIPFINGLVQDCGNSIANAMQLPQSSAKPSIHELTHWCPHNNEQHSRMDITEIFIQQLTIHLKQHRIERVNCSNYNLPFCQPILSVATNALALAGLQAALFVYLLSAEGSSRLKRVGSL